jgi:hypothetical protein
MLKVAPCGEDHMETAVHNEFRLAISVRSYDQKSSMDSILRFDLPFLTSLISIAFG